MRIKRVYNSCYIEKLLRMQLITGNLIKFYNSNLEIRKYLNIPGFIDGFIDVD